MSQLHRHPAPGALQGVQGVGDSSEQDVNVSLGDDGRVELPGWHPVGRERPDGPVRGVLALAAVLHAGTRLLPLCDWRSCSHSAKARCDAATTSGVTFP